MLKKIIKEIEVKLEINDPDLAKILKVTRMQIYNWKTGATKNANAINAKKIIRLAKRCGLVVNLEDIISDE